MISSEKAILNRWLDPFACTGCRSCEIACSLHHAKVFDPSQSSIRVFRNSINGEIVIEHYDTCDGCRKENSPLCIEFCPRDAISSQILGLAPC